MIKQIQIENFKSLRNVTVDLDPLTVLIGRSGSGKTNFVEAIRFLRNFLLRGHSYVDELNNQGKWKELLAASANEQCIKIGCLFHVEGIEGDFAYSLEFGSNGSGSAVICLDESLLLGEAPIFRISYGADNSNPRGYHWIHAPNVAVPPNINQIRPPILGALPALEEAVIAHISLTAGIGCYDFPGDVFKPNSHSNSAHHANNGGLHDDGSNFLESMRDIMSNLKDLAVRKQISAALRQMSPTIISIELDDHRDPKGAVVGHDFGDRGRIGFPLSQESEGLRRFYAHLLALYQTPSKQTLVFEEPEKGIYPGALEVLASEMQRCADSGRSQVILTTHSPGFLDHFDPECLRVVEIDANVTHIGRLAEEQLESVKQSLLSTGELLTTDPARAAQSSPEPAE